MTQAQIIVFILTSLVIIITPGQDMILVMSRAISQGSRAGMVTAAGVSTGLLGHTLLATLGLGSLLMASEILFTILKGIGAGYLVYLGFRLLTSKNSELDLQKSQPVRLRKLFATGALSNLSNPKITIFYFAFLPQFFSSDAVRPAQYLLLLGVTFALLTLLVKVPVGYFAGNLSSWLRTRPLVLRWIDRVSGTVFIGLGIKLAFEKR
ncbi:MAG: LysE family translocator [Anaerolineaceae bacterium]|nr:LysE family translocator [Anaerolineaceae bacterium]